MTRHHNASRLVTAVVTAIVLVCVPALAEPSPDPDVCSTNNAGQVVRLCRESAPSLPEASPAGRATPVLLGAYPDWDYWNLDTSAVRDTAGLMHFGVRLWQYSDYTPNYDRYVVDPTGQIVETWLDWYGLGGVPAGTDRNGHNFFVRPSATNQVFGAVDSQDYIYVFNTSAESTGWEVHYTKLDPQGNTLIDWTVITTGADCWNWYVQPVVNSQDRIMVTWIRDTEDICAIYSDDHGVTWSDILVLLPNAGIDQAASVKTVVGADDSLHFVWRTLNWSTDVEKLWYAKVRSDWTVVVDETPFYVSDAAWYPYASIDNQDSIHVTFAPTYDVATDMYYTRLRGDLDLDGLSATDALLTAIPERLFHSDPDTVHYPANQVDEYGTVHVIYEEGEYGRFTDKDLYYIALCSLDGDLNCDGTVDLEDYNVFADLLVGPGNAAPPGSDATDFANADLDNDGDVDLADVAAFQAAFGSSEE